MGHRDSAACTSYAAGFHVDRAAAAIADLMGQLGYDRYLDQGGDWGAVITRRLAEAHAEHVVGAHFNMLFAFPNDMAAQGAWAGVTPKELEAFSRASEAIADGTAYSEIQGTKPQTLAYGMHDSPAAVLAWQVETSTLFVEDVRAFARAVAG